MSVRNLRDLARDMGVEVVQRQPPTVPPPVIGEISRGGAMSREPSPEFITFFREESRKTRKRR